LKVFAEFIRRGVTLENRGLALKIQFIGIVASAFVFVSLILPWWTASLTGYGRGFFVNVYLYSPNVSMHDVQLTNSWVWLVFVLVVTCGLLGLAGSVGEKEINQKLLIGSGLLALLSLAIFVGGVQLLIIGNLVMGAPLAVYYSTSYDGFSYVLYLSYGFWLALAAAILMFFASTKA